MSGSEMSIANAPIEPTRPPSSRASGQAPQALTALAGRIRSLQRSEPRAIGDERTATLAELALLQLQLERLALGSRRHGVDLRQLHADVFALAERVDLIARLWPPDARPNQAAASLHRPPTVDGDRVAA